jgi:Ca2+-transporting ATPase
MKGIYTMDKYYSKTSEEVMKILGVSDSGLNDQDVTIGREKFGYNELKQSDRQGFAQVLLGQFKDFLVVILLVVAVISIFLGELESTLVILVVVAINGVLGTIQHIKAQQSLDSLKALSSPTAKVLRNGQKIEIPSRELVVGDIVYLDAGDYISADGRILETHSLQVNESSLTGESESVLKTSDPIYEDQPAIGDRTNMVFSGSYVTYGRAVVLVTATGMNTEIGKIANLLETAKDKKTPLQVSLDGFGKKLALMIMIICAFVFIIDMFRGRDIIESFMFGVSLAVAAIPEALSSIVTIVLALGTQKMADQNAIVRKLHSVESLGSISVICSDKTGTLTQNKMTVKKVFIDDKIIDYNPINQVDALGEKLMKMALLCNDAVSADQKGIGDPTEVALVNLGKAWGLDELTIRENHTRLDEVPFDSDRKLMSTLNRFGGKSIMITKGAPDVLLPRAIKIETSHGLETLTRAHRDEIERVNKAFSMDGLRVLAFAYKEIKNDLGINAQDEDKLTFLGLVAMMDPPRLESGQAVASCKSAGIKPVMITGDHKITACAIAKELGILEDESQAMEGFELENIDDEQLKERVEDISVYARVSPEHKIRIVRAWQQKGNVVAMTGDGVNDAPALKQADIGVAMGITGTDVAKDAAAMVLTDDNFSTIVKAVAYGRSIFTNIKNSIRFLLSGNTAGIMSVLYASIAALPAPFAPVHLLFINLLTDSLPAIAIGLEPHNPNVMRERPRDINTSILNKGFVNGIMIEGLIIAFATMAAFHLGLASGGAGVAKTMAFATLCLSRLFHGFNSRSKESIFSVGVFSNKFVWFAAIIGCLLLTAVLNIRPLMEMFEVAPLSGTQTWFVYGLSLMPLVLVQTYKILFAQKSYSRSASVFR